MSALGKIIFGLTGATLGLAVLSQAQGGGDSVLLRDSFRIGREGGALCQAQSAPTDPAVRTMFDRAWTVVCQDPA